MNTQHDRILFIGIGGGNDIFSTILAILSLRKAGWKWNQCSIAGVLSPFHIHTGTTLRARDLIEITPESKRFIDRNDGTKGIGFIDATVSRIIRETPQLGIKKVYGLPLSHGSVYLTALFRNYFADRFDFFVLVDVGGDCFYGGQRDTHVLSPMFDAMTVQGFNESLLPGMLFEAGPGTDGELEPESLKSALSSLDAQESRLDTTVMQQWEELYLRYIGPVRTGNTVPATIDAFKREQPFMTRRYRARAHIGTQKMYAEFDQRIDTGMCKSFYIVDPRQISNPFMVRCSGPHSWFCQTQVAEHSTNCEANLEYLRNPETGKLTQFLTPSPLFPTHERRALIEHGLSEMRNRACDSAYMHLKDWNSFIENTQGELYQCRSEFDGLVEISPIQ